MRGRRDSAQGEFEFSRASPGAPGGRIHLYYSNRSERLLEALAENLARVAEGAERDPFDATTVIVPNRNVETWLKFGVARALGVAARLEVHFLRGFLSDLVGEAAPGTRLIEGPLLLGQVLSLLYDRELLADPELAPVRAFLRVGAEGAEADGESDAAERKRFQLAVQIARLFEEYAYSRFELLDGWARGPSLGGTGLAETERWQRRLWLALSARCERRAGARGERWLTTTSLANELASARIRLPPRLHVFGISYVARGYQRLFAALARRCALHVYTLNPCMEFWEDLPAQGELSRLPRRSDRVGASRLAADEDPFRLADLSEEGGDPAALRLWGRPGRENVRLLNELSDCDFSASFTDPLEGAAPTLLRRIQHDVLVRASGSAALLPAPVDGSLRILACPGVRREVETIAAEIWRLVREDRPAPGEPPLRFNDIAVIIPGGGPGPSGDVGERDVYQAQIASVFRELYELPHHLVDLPASGGSRLVEAFALLLGLPGARLSRREVLRVATHPRVIARFPEARAEEWAALCESVGIAHGGDRADHRGTYIERDLLNWDQGLRRIALGAFLAGRRSGEERLFVLGDESYPPEEIPPSRLSEAAGFAALARSLLADARALEGARLTLPEWAARFQALLSAYLVPDGPDDERMLHRLRAEVQTLEEIDLSAGQPGGDRAREVGFRVPAELMLARLAGLSGERGQYLAWGVVVSSFLPMRALPFRVIFVAGLDEGRFPGSDRRSQLDLRAARRMAGDVTPREQDKYMFLEALLCARDRLYLSYVARDPLTGIERQPSSVVRELGAFVERDYLGPGRAEELVHRPPLRRHEERAEVVVAPEGRREQRMHELAGHLREHLAGAVGGDSERGAALRIGRLREGLAPSLWRQLAARLELPLLAPEPAAPVPGEGGGAGPGEPLAPAAPVVRLSIWALRRFLECPLQGSTSALLGLREEDAEDYAARDEERFEIEFLPRLVLLRSVFVDALAEAAAQAPSGGPGDALRFRRIARGRLDERLTLLERDGVLPTGPFGAVERRREERVLDGWFARLGEVDRGPFALRRIRFGEGEAGAGDAGDVRPPLILDGIASAKGTVRVELAGRTQPLLVPSDPAGAFAASAGSPRSSLLLFTRRESKDGDRGHRDGLRAFFDHLVLSAAGETAPEHRALLIAYDEREGRPHHEELRLAAVAPERARAYLAQLASELLSQVHDYLLPCEAVFQHRRKPEEGIADRIDDLRENDFQSFSFDYGPVPNPRRYEPPVEARAIELAERRFGLYFELQGGATPPSSAPRIPRAAAKPKGRK